jgi:hypothetical protein
MGKWWPIIKIETGKNLSDDEYVERQRLAARQAEVANKVFVPVMSLFLIASLGTLLWACFLAIQGRVFGPNVALSVIALIIGFGLGGLCHLCISTTMMSLGANRTRKLMIKYYDAIQELAASEHITRSAT